MGDIYRCKTAIAHAQLIDAQGYDNELKILANKSIRIKNIIHKPETTNINRNEIQKYKNTMPSSEGGCGGKIELITTQTPPKTTTAELRLIPYSEFKNVANLLLNCEKYYYETRKEK